ncbi:hypothetical protein KIN20_002999 [Parelaphostrongylus tenuis]|uniref:Uncharacterized protein n=1 Tax=Parelaphostrongylus tenuis TaxID=148309 RepID=A0AAD5QH48_PARTN|nr:hypothetical protein KIN20_002999 [Parelaphostrongylus tenuis]
MFDLFRHFTCVKAQKELDVDSDETQRVEVVFNMEISVYLNKVQHMRSQCPLTKSLWCRTTQEHLTQLRIYNILKPALPTLVSLSNVMTLLGDILADDGVGSVQMLCEESDCTTDTDTSALIRGTAKFFNRNSPKDGSSQSPMLLSVSQRNSRILPEPKKKDEQTLYA